MSSHSATRQLGSPDHVLHLIQDARPEPESAVEPVKWGPVRSDPQPGREPTSPNDAAPGRQHPVDAPDWMHQAQRMASKLEAAIAAGEISALAEARIQRAWAAWELGGVSDRHIAKVSHLLSRAYGAIRERPDADLETLVAECSSIVHAGLPPSLQRHVSYEQAASVVRGLLDEPTLWPAVVRGTGQLLAWEAAAQAHAARAISLALDARSQR